MTVSDETIAALEKLNTPTLANALEELIGDGDLRGRLGARAREVFEEKFSREALVAAVGEIYGAIGEGAD